jgi:hypothetical protein
VWWRVVEDSLPEIGFLENQDLAFNNIFFSYDVIALSSRLSFAQVRTVLVMCDEGASCGELSKYQNLF